MARKTIAVATVKANANRALATVAEGNTPEYRKGIAAVLEDVLTQSGNYSGFRFTDGALGKKDETRRMYF